MHASKKKINSLYKKEEKTAWLMLLPNTLGLIIFVFIPIIFAFYISFHSWNGLTEMKFLGIKNYLKLFRDTSFLKSLLVTLKYALMYVPAIFFLSILFATLVHAITNKMQQVVRTVIFFPYCVSAVISGLLWGFLFDPLNGYINQILRIVGLPSQAFLGDPKQALTCIAVTSVWINVGYNMIIMLAAIKDIPKDYYEAASIDGANAFQKFIKITLPQLKNATSFVLVLSTINSFQVFDQIKILTSGGPNSSTTTTVYNIFQQAFEQNKLGYASAQAFILFIVLMILSLIQLKVMSAQES
ncbi:carbohydrate ABC transporter permease [Robinsoniella sp. KNHs210]|uniref:carbohydrate ABC transporter permease n=1 Tax=Robinsoniella sp. KNHs210 TaxID=1469950 RepID=UPI000694103D|nr:sugar ABC transporter permease [Robinsoniella sp. KNHs210]